MYFCPHVVRNRVVQIVVVINGGGCFCTEMPT